MKCEEIMLMRNPQQKKPVLPNFLIVGAARCGTTSLHHYLRQHPDVFMCDPKEPRFLSGLANHPGAGPGDRAVSRVAVRTLESYVRLFENGAGRKAVGEASVETLYFYKQSIPAIRKTLGDPKILMILRDPVDSLFSTFNFMRRLGREHLPLREALRREEERKRKGYDWMWRYREARLYAEQVRAFQSHFSRVCVLFYDDLNKNPMTVLRTVCEFLEIDDQFSVDAGQVLNASGIPKSFWFNTLFIKPKRLHKVARKVGTALLGINRWVALREHLMRMNLEKPDPMPADIRHDLKVFYRDNVLLLQDLVGADLKPWLIEGDAPDANFSTP